jgi:hypothetical protein
VKRLACSIAILLACSVGTLSAEEAKESQTAGAWRSSEVPGAELFEVMLPGPLLQVEAFESPAGERSLMLLVEAADDSPAPHFIYQLHLDASRGLSDLPVVVPPDADALVSVDLAGDGNLELLVGEHGRIFRVGGEGKLEVVLEGDRVDLKGRARLGADDSTPRTGELVLASVGRAERLALEAGGGGLRVVEQYRIPQRAKMQGSWLRLSSPLVSALPDPESPGAFLYLVGPEAVGDRRLRTLILEPGGSLEGSTRELWSQLPSPESVEESLYALLNDEVVLLVTTVQSDRRGIFEKEKFRALRLTEDRSRSGGTAMFETTSRTRSWYSAGMTVADVDRDGFDDLVLVQPKGLGGGKLVVEAFMGLGSGEFDDRARRTNLEVETETWSYGKDLDGDGLPDLVLIEDEALIVFTGVTDSKSNLVVREESAWRVPIGGVNDHLRVLDVQGDERPEVVLIERRGASFSSPEPPESEDSDSSSESEEEPLRGRLSLVVFSNLDGG